MRIYLVTLLLMDRQHLRSNPLWHTCIACSYYDEITKKIEVIDTWGFYGLPLAEGSKLKKITNLNLDNGNHGLLRHEEMRYLDLGAGLYGANFAVTKEKFDELQERCKKMEREQHEAIAQHAKDLNLHPKAVWNTRVYPYEDHARTIFDAEIKWAKENKQSPRLKPFKLTLSKDANTCKAQALKLLDGILTKEQMKRIVGLNHAVSYFSGPVEPIRFYSVGPTRTHTTRSGEQLHYRERTDAVKLFWTVPPQKIEASNEICELFTIHPDHCQDTKKLVSQLQRIEWLFRNENFDQKYTSHCKKLIECIKNHYQVFGNIETKKTEEKESKLNQTIKWLFSQPRNNNEKIIMDKITNAKNLINSLYSAIIDNWKFEERVENISYITSTLEKKADLHEEDDEDLETLASYLSDKSKKKLCDIIGKKYWTIKPVSTSQCMGR